MLEIINLPGQYTEHDNLLDDICAYICMQESNDYTAILHHDFRPSVFEALTDRRIAEWGWYPFKAGSSVLEIGAGFGEATGNLCKQCGSVTSVERNAHKAKALAWRHKTENNLRVYAGDWKEIKSEGCYDYVVVHDFENCQASWEADAYLHALQRLAAHLRPQGCLLLNVVNRAALKYWCGETRNYNFPAFAELDGRAGKDGFTRGEMSRMLARAGFSRNKFYYPMPDRNKPRLIYTDICQPNLDMLKTVEFYRRGKPSIVNDERIIWEQVIRDDFFREFVDAFMVECCASSGVPADIECAKLSADRPRKLAMCTSIYNNIVVKIPLFQEGKAHIQEMAAYKEDLREHGIPMLEMEMRDDKLFMPRIKAISLGDYLKCLAEHDARSFVECLHKLYAFICQSSEHIPAENSRLCVLRPDVDWGPVLKHAYIEMIDLNCFYDNGFIFYDQEYMRNDFPAKYVMYRELVNLYYAHPEIEKYISLKSMQIEFGLVDVLDILEHEEFDVFLAGLLDSNMYQRVHLPHGEAGQKKRQYDARRESYLFAGCASRKLVIIGTGARFQRYMEQYGKRFSPDILVDNSKDKWGTYLCGCKVQSPEALLGLDDTQVHVIICLKDYEEIEAQLLGLGLYNYRIF